MSKSKFNPLITASVISAVYLAGLSNVSQAVVPTTATDSLTSMAVEQYQDNQSVLPAANAEGQRRYIIRFNEAAVATYNGTGTFQPIPRQADGKIESRSPAVNSYVSHLKQQQNNFLSTLSNQVGRQVTPLLTYQYAINGLAVYLTPEEANTAQRNAAVAQVYLDRDYFLNTDAGPTLIGANNVWVGAAPAAGTAFGEGVVLGILDSGANFDHPSFAATGDDGYTHTNPLGSGNYLGVCDPSNTDQYIASYTCNDKLIGGYDFIDDLVDPTDTEVIGPEDENGHGSHTASTAGGNLVSTASANGVDNIEISGVARHANIIPFDVCFTNPAGQGLCAGAASVASMDQIIADGIVDVVNYSISGGTSPWNDAVSLAFLSATDTGVFVSASAGNSGPGPATLGHVEPWTSSVGASTHNREFESLLSIVGEPTLADIAWNSSNGPDASGLFNVPTPINSSTNVDASNFEGCLPFAPGSFAGQIALISRGACSFAIKVANAETGNAVGVIIYNNVAGGLNMNVGDATTIPSISISQADGDAIVAFLAGPPRGGPEVLIESPIIVNTGQADVMAGFSSRGPSPFEYNKPDVTGPGVSILAAFNDNDEVGTGTPAEYGIISGTSMSSPHNAGAAALLKELQPTWSAAEIKSALMLTAVTAGVTKEDGVTPADPFDRGAGRIQVDVASSTGLVMDETAFRFLLADPANGGDPKTLNVASYKNDNCVGTCTFQRKFTSVASGPVEYNANLSGMTGTVNPANFVVNPGQTVTIDVEVDGGALPAGAVSFGELQINEVPSSFNPVDFALGAPITITDNTYDGTTASMDCAPITVSGISSSVFSAELELAMNHTWIGDLTVKLINPAGDELAVMNDINDSSNLLSTSPISLFDGAAISAADMGSTITGAGVVCQDDFECEFAPAPNGEPEPPSTFADLGTGSANGDWMLCGGDNASGDIGDIQAATLRVLEGVTTVPSLHLPLVVTGLPEAPDIAVAPASLSATLDADTTTDVNLNISNSPVAGADLNWSFGSGQFSLVYAEQVDETGTITNGIVSGFFLPENGGAGAGAYSADDFVLSQDASIETMFFEGFANGTTLDVTSTSIQLQVFADDAGSPAGHPEDGLNSALFALDIPIADPSLDLTGNNIGIDIAAANGGAPLDLPAGTYWVSVFPTQDILLGDAGRWGWFAAGPDVSGAPAQLITPLLFGGIPDWTGLVGLTAEPNFEQLRYNIAGSSTCGAPWIITSSAGGVVSPGGDIDVTVTLDATGVAAGVYNATLCVDSDDPDEPQILVPVTMTVEGESDLIFANGFE